VTATAKPAAGWQFLAWRGDAESSDPSIQVVLNGDTSIEAVFGTNVELSAIGNGSIIAQPSATVYPYGAVIRLTGIPSIGQRFSSWGNPINSESNPVDYTVTQANPTISGVFEPLGEQQATLTVSIEGSGNVSASPTAITLRLENQRYANCDRTAGIYLCRWSGDAHWNPESAQRCHER
jgi:hypothetical protein